MSGHIYYSGTSTGVNGVRVIAFEGDTTDLAAERGKTLTGEAGAFTIPGLDSTKTYKLVICLKGNLTEFKTIGGHSPMSPGSGKNFAMDCTQAEINQFNAGTEPPCTSGRTCPEQSF